MTKKETAKFVIQVIVSIASAILTALGATSVHGVLSKGSPSGLNDQGDSYFFSVNSNAKPPLSAGRTVMEPPCNKTAFFTMGSRSA